MKPKQKWKRNEERKGSPAGSPALGLKLRGAHSAMSYRIIISLACSFAQQFNSIGHELPFWFSSFIRWLLGIPIDAH